jgi:hypothetical protein
VEAHKDHHTLSLIGSILFPAISSVEVKLLGVAWESEERLLSMLDAGRQEFEGLIHDNSALKNQREEMESKGKAF